MPKRFVTTAVRDKVAATTADLVDRQFKANGPNALSQPFDERLQLVVNGGPSRQSMTLPVPTRSWYVISSAGTQWICSSQRRALALFKRKRFTSLRHGSV